MLMPNRNTQINLQGGFSNGTTTVNGSTYISNLTITTRIGNTPNTYKAANSIEFVGEYVDNGSEEYEAFIVNQTNPDPNPTTGTVNSCNVDGYRYGFNGKELDKDITGTTAYDYGFRIYNPTLGKFFSVDPLTKSYPYYSPYHFAGNTPIQAIDLDGLEPKSIIGDVKSVTTKLGVEKFYRLNDAAITLLCLATGVDSKVLKETWVEVDQKFHDGTTKYNKGAITLGKYIFFTGNYGDPKKEGNDTRAWFDLLSHEIGHRQQAEDKSAASYFGGYIIDVIKVAYKKGTTVAKKIHDDLKMEKDAEKRRTIFNSFIKNFEYKDKDGNMQNRVYDILNDSKKTDGEKSIFIQDMYNQLNQKKEEKSKPNATA
jgi:RHS repeat-associated protein